MNTVKRERSCSPSGDGNSAKRTCAKPLHPNLANRDEAGLLQFNETPTPERVDIVADGDAVIIVGEKISQHSKQEGIPEDNQMKVFTVRSPTVLAASDKLMNALLSSSGTPSMIPGIQNYRLESDKPKPVATLLRILHAQFDQVPSDKPNIVEIHEIAMLAEKYDLMPLLRPWARHWMQYFRKLATPLGFGNTCRCLSVAWLFGDATLFQSSIDNIAHYCRVYQSKTATLQNPHRLGFPTYGVPGIYGIVGNLRLKCLESLLEPLGESVDNLLRGVWVTQDRIQCRLANPHQPDDRCNLSLLATLMRSLVSAELWPVPKADSCLETFNTINDKIRKLEVVCKPSHQKYGCDNIFNGDLPCWAHLPQANLNEAQLKHLRTQAAKTGLKNT